MLESQYTLSLQVKDRKGMEDSLHKMIEGSIINDFQCEACNQRVDVFKRNLIAETPNVLIVHLQRIVFNFDTFQNDKINSRFEFPNILSLKDFSFREVMKAENRPNDIMYSDEMKHLMNISDEEYTYKLVGVNIHIGTAEYGHYYSLINTKRGSEEVDESKVEWTQTEKDQWK
jgi:ubiquitin carboxyl-terminal hydrolase 34